VCDRKTDLLLQIWHYFSLMCRISVLPVQYIMKVILPAIYSCYFVYCGSCCKFRICKEAIMGLLVSAGENGAI